MRFFIIFYNKKQDVPLANFFGHCGWQTDGEYVSRKQVCAFIAKTVPPLHETSPESVYITNIIELSEKEFADWNKGI